jgi:hypothetical protein
MSSDPDPGSYNYFRDYKPPKDPRFIPFTALVNYRNGSDIMTIDRLYGTVSQNIQYPKFSDLLKNNQ